MTTEELYQLGEKAYAEENYEEALKYYTQAANEHVDAATTVPLCYINLATQVSIDASNHANDTEYLVHGQQKAVKLLDLAIRTALRLYRDHLDYPSVCNVAISVITQAVNLQYSLVSTGLTTAYRITNTTTHIEKMIEKTTVGGVTVNEEVLWEDIIGTETETFVSLTSFDMSDYHILGPDEKTKRVKASLATSLQNVIQIAEILEILNREYDAHMVRASIACAIAESEGGDRSMLLSAEWFIIRAKELAKATLSEDVYNEWLSLVDGTIENYTELSFKYAALLRSYRKQGQKPYISKFYRDSSLAPSIEVSEEYAKEQEINKMTDPHLKGKGDFFEIFLTVFAQIDFKKIFPTILFASIISLFCGGLFNVFSAEAGAFVKLFGIIWFIVTMVLTFFRTITDADEFRTNNTYNIYLLTMLATGVLFSINFIVPLIAYIVLRVLSNKYK